MGQAGHNSAAALTTSCPSLAGLEPDLAMNMPPGNTIVHCKLGGLVNHRWELMTQEFDGWPTFLKSPLLS